MKKIATIVLSLPYSLVKDVRTGQETSQIQNVMDGDLDDFIFAYLKMQVS